MRRSFGNPGRLDMAALTPSPAERFVESKGQALWGTFAFLVIAGGVLLLGVAIFKGAQHLQLLALAHGG